MVPRVVRGADAAADAGLAGDRARRVDADPGADRQRQDADRVPVVHQPADVRAGRRPTRARCRVLYLSPLKALAVDIERNLRAPLAGIANRAAARGDAHRRPDDRHPHRRHAGDRARPLPARAGRHPDHDAGVALPAADVERARGAALDRHGDHRRDPRAGADQARRPSGAVARAPRRAGRTRVQRIGLSATQRPLDEVARFLGGVAEPRPAAAKTCRRLPRTARLGARRSARATSRRPTPPSTTSSRRPAQAVDYRPSPSSTPRRRSGST